MSYDPDWLITFKDAVRLQKFLESKENNLWRIEDEKTWLLAGFPGYFTRQCFDEFIRAIRCGVKKPIVFGETKLVWVWGQEISSFNYAIEELFKKKKIDFRVLGY